MKVDIVTSKLYYGFPVILVGYRDEKWKYNVSTSSSSYSLGDMITVGIHNGTNCAEQIKKYGQFTVNVPAECMLSKIELCGFHSKINKIGLADLTYDKGIYVDAPLIDDCLLSLECVVDAIVEHGQFVNFVATIKRRAVEPDILAQDGSLINEKFNPIYFVGDEQKRIYRYLNDKTKNLGENMECSPHENECG